MDGFDIVLMGSLAFTAWALWRQRPIALPGAVGRACRCLVTLGLTF